MTNNSSSSPDLLAKSSPPVSLVDHSRAVADTTVELLDTPVIQERVNSIGSTGLTASTLLELGEFTGLLHDTGKAHPAWQRAISASSDEDVRLPPHSARSALFAFAVARKRELPLRRGIAAVLAILHHHTPLTSNRMQYDYIGEYIGDINNLEDTAHTLAKAGFPAVTLDEQTRDSFLTALSQYQSLEPRADEYDFLGALVTFLRTALIQADHYASATAAGEEAPLPDRLATSDISLFTDIGYTLRPFQQQIATTEATRLVGLAGCGEGKTHSALQWGEQVTEDGRANRLIFAMPTQVTTNNLLFSLTGGADGEDIAHISSESAALYHSASESFYETDEAEKRWDLSYVRLTERARRWFQRPVTVTTVDHVLSTLVNGYNWATVARGNLLQSAVVFDELHAYDVHTTGHILGGIAALDRAGVPWYVMSATIPPQIREQDPLDEGTQVRSDGRLDETSPAREPFTVTVKHSTLDAGTVLNIVGDSAARRIMIVRNTVADARELARELLQSGEDVVYYSSAFTQEDREKKESEIRTQFGGSYDQLKDRQFLVCTQVCEISLDLSADLLLTDVAPIDAVIQRAGRLHRDGVHHRAGSCDDTRGGSCSQCAVLPPDHVHRCVVFAPLDQHSRWLPYASDTDSTHWELLERTRDVLEGADQYRFDRSLAWVDDVYSGLGIEFDASKLLQISQTDWLYGDARQVAPDADAGRDQLQIRDISTHKRGMFMREYREGDGETWTPDERWQVEHDCPRLDRCGVHEEATTPCDTDFWQFASQYSVEIPQWWLQTDDHPVNVVGYLIDRDDGVRKGQIASMDYSYTLGADPETAD